MIQINHLYKSFENKEVLHDINACFENGKTVVLDYKTDRVSEAGQLAGLYHRQLEVYKIAAEECFGTDVSELLLYSFALGEEVKL